MLKKDIEKFYPKTKQEWRDWLIKNHKTQESIWVIFYKQKTNISTITWSEAVEEALCFGWIDSVKKKLDTESSIQYFSKRRPKSTWSKINKEKILELTKQGKMSKAGLEIVEIAKQNGSWTLLDQVEDLIIPKDLEIEFIKKPKSKEYFLTLSKSTKKVILYWLVNAKTNKTRQKRISEIIECAELNQKPKHIR